jgi:hypothetical protein
LRRSILNPWLDSGGVGFIVGVGHYFYFLILLLNPGCCVRYSWFFEKGISYNL